jgi:hypothetical protein
LLSGIATLTKRPPAAGSVPASFRFAFLSRAALFLPQIAGGLLTAPRNEIKANFLRVWKERWYDSQTEGRTFDESYPARIRTWTKRAKISCATVTLPGRSRLS